MKPLPLVLALSLAGNLALAVALWWRPRSPAPVPTPASAPASGRVASDGTKESGALPAAFASGDPAALAAAGVPADAIRALIVGRAFDAFQARLRAGRPAQLEGKYWKRPQPDYAQMRQLRIESDRATREFSEAIRQTYGDDLNTLFGDRKLGIAALPAEKQEKLRQIDRDYTEMEQQIYADQNAGIQLPSDRDKLKLLRAEKERDIAATLTPEEREQLALRDSPTANTVRYRYGDALETEEDYKRIYALQKAFDDRFNTPEAHAANQSGSEAARMRREAEQKLIDDISAAMGPEKWATVLRTNDQDANALAAVTRRLNLPAQATTAVFATRESYAAQSMRINAAPDLSAADRKAQLQALATKAQADLNATLGPEGGAAFAQQAAWISLLKSGQAYSLNPADAGGQRQYATTAHALPAPKAAAAAPRN